MKAKSILILAAISVALIACSKKKDETGGPATGENKKYLTRVTTLITGSVADGSPQTTSTTDYSYDSKKRLILAKTGTTTTSYAYYDDGNLYTVTISNGNIANRSVYEFTHEGGKLKSYRLKGYKDNVVNTNILYDYVYNGDQVSEIHFDIYYLLYTYDSKGNIVKIFSHGNPEFSYIYQYDDKKSKFTNSMFKFPTVGDIAGDRSNPNNRTFRTTEGLNPNIKSTFVYTYDADGYPTTCTESADYAASSTYKSTYTYSTLN
jgi:major membrane immunogen (membrane-anchored lipoprotein)